MPDRRVTEDTTITAAGVAAGDWFDLVDVSDATDAASGTNKKIAASEVAALVSTLLNLSTTYQPADSDLTAIAALTTTAFGRSLLALADAAALRTAAALVPGTDVQAYDAELAALAGLASAADRVPYFTGSAAASLATFTAAARTFTALASLTAQQQYLQVQGINPQTGTTYTLATTDQTQLITQSNAGAITTTVPQDSAVTFPVGAWTELYQLGAGQITVAAGAGATLRATPTAKARAQYSRLFLQKIAANTWALSGDIAAT